MIDYKSFLIESRYKSHGLVSVKKFIPKLLEPKTFDIIYNYDTDDFSIYFSKLKNTTKELLISRCEIIGYFPSTLQIDNVTINSGKTAGGHYIDSGKNIDDYIDFIKKVDINNYNEIYIQFEKWLDEDVVLPKTLYHVCRSCDVEKIKKLGIHPKSKHKISHHPDRIYFNDNMNYVNSTISQFKEQDEQKKMVNNYSVITIDTDKIPSEYKLLLRLDPNFLGAYYTTQNISPFWII